MAGLEKPNSWVLQDWNLQRAWGKCCFFSKVCILFMGTKLGHLFHPSLHLDMTNGWFPAKGKWVKFILGMFRPGTWIFPISSMVSLFFFTQLGSQGIHGRHMVLMAEQPPNTFPKWPPERAVQSEIYNYLGLFCEQKINCNCFKPVKVFFFIFSENKPR